MATNMNRYQYGNTARELEEYDNTSRRRAEYANAAQRLGEIPDSRRHNVTQGKKHKHFGMGYAAFIAVALVVTSFILVRYVSLKADIVNRLEHISQLETQLNDLKLENDATYSRINSNMDLEQIREAAINELGMTYAKEGQVESFVSENGDYVRQLSSIPE